MRPNRQKMLVLITRVLLCALGINSVAVMSAKHCASKLIDSTQGLKIELNGASRIKSVDSIFKALLTGTPFELKIPKNVKPRLSLKKQSHQVRYSAMDFPHFPYSLKAAHTDDDKFRHDQIIALSTFLEKIESAQHRGIPLSQLMRKTHLGKYFFSSSPAAAKSRSFFSQPHKVTSLTERIIRLGRFPWVYIDQHGDYVVTNRNFISHLRQSGQKYLNVYRGHGDFDVYFYHLLMDGSKRTKLREDFAEWLQRNILEVSDRRKVTKDVLRSFAERLRNQHHTLDSILGDMSKKMTTSTMFTSLTPNTAHFWLEGIGKTERDGLTEVLELRLDLTKLDDTYLEQIIYGNDLEVEVVFPFATDTQRAALRNAVSIQSYKEH